MLGHIIPYLPDMDEESKRIYKAYYCGLCKQLGRSSGNLSRLMLNYDMTFVAIMCDALENVGATISQQRCLLHPDKPRDIAWESKGISLAADVLIMLAKLKALDDMRDEKGAGALIRTPLYHYASVAGKKAEKRHPSLALIFEHESAAQATLERNSISLDELAMPTAKMTQAIMEEIRNDENRDTLSQFGFALGRYIYIMDAFRDMKEDAEKGKFNIFNLRKTDLESIKAECYMALGELSWWYKQTGIEKFSKITDNIIYGGLEMEIIGTTQEIEKNGRIL